MARLLSIDFGKKRCGIAVTDTLQIIANGLTTVATSTLNDFIASYLAKEKVERRIVGAVRNLNPCDIYGQE